MAELDDIKPWDRQPGETSKAYEAFQAYLDLGSERSIRTTAERLNKSTAHIAGWSGKYGWPDRARAWDSMPRRTVVSAYEEMATEIAEQHRRVATKLMDKLESNVDLLKPGADPTMRFSTALGAARQSHQFATDLSKPADASKAAITKAIEDIVNKLVGDE